MPRQLNLFNPSDWRQALDSWSKEQLRAERAGDAAHKEINPLNWWNEAFADPPTESERKGHKCGEKEMLTIIAYDICDPKRLRHVAEHCEDYGLRVQYSMFECRLEAPRFEYFWRDLQALIDPREDRLVAYTVCARCAREIHTAGKMTSNTPAPIAYVF